MLYGIEHIYHVPFFLTKRFGCCVRFSLGILIPSMCLWSKIGVLFDDMIQFSKFFWLWGWCCLLRLYVSRWYQHRCHCQGQSQGNGDEIWRLNKGILSSIILFNMQIRFALFIVLYSGRGGCRWWVLARSTPRGAAQKQKQSFPPPHQWRGSRRWFCRCWAKGILQNKWIYIQIPFLGLETMRS